MRNKPLIAIVIASTLWTACAKKETTIETGSDTSVTSVTEVTATTASDGMTSTTTSTMPAATSAYDLMFIDTMTKHHQMALDMAKAGAPKFASKELEALAGKMVEDQTSEIAQLRQWRDQWYAGAAPSENMEMPGMSGMGNIDMSHMQMMNGKALDVMFVDMMTPHHEGAIAMSKDALEKAEHQEIKDFSQKVIDAQQKEIAQMQQWKKTWAK